MLQVRRDLCLGCGLCVQSCPRRAISLLWGQAEIDPYRCIPCCLCRQVCPQGAIIELVPISGDELQTTVTTLKQRVEDLIASIEKLRC